MPAPQDPIQEARSQWLRHGWDEAADGMALVTSLTRVQQLLQERIDAALKPFGLTFARFEVIRLIAFTRTGAVAMSRLGSLLQVHPTSVTSAVDRLVQQGYVERSRSDVDRRVVHASLTPEGSRVVEQATLALNTQVFEQHWLPTAGTADLVRVLTTLRTSLGDTPA